MSNGTALENTYRRAMRSYPSRWRAQHGEELLGVMLDVAASQNKHKATFSDVAHLAAHGLAARMNEVLSVIPRRRRDRLAAVGLITGTSLALIMMILGELGRWFQAQSYTFTDDPFGLFTTPAAIVFSLILGAFLASATSRDSLAKMLHLTAIATCIGLAVYMKTADPTIVVPLRTFACFAGASSLALLGNPFRTPTLRRVVLVSTPLIGGVLAFTSYLQGGGFEKTFWRPNQGTSLIEGFTLSVWTTDLMLLAALLVVSGSKLKPWAHLLLIPLAAAPLSALFLRIYGAGLHVSIDLGLRSFSCSLEMLTLCSIAAVTSAWFVWKRPTLVYPQNSSKLTAS